MKTTLATIIEPALRILPPMMTSDAAKAMLLAIGMQESRLIHRKQIGGPAMGLWQFERGGGVAGVLRHPRTQGHAATVCWRKNSGEAFLLVVSQETAFTPFSHSSIGERWLGSGHAQPGQSNPFT